MVVWYYFSTVFSS